MTLPADTALPAPVPQSPPPLWRRFENGCLGLVLAAMCLVPVTELVLRATSRTGIFAAAAIVQHLGLALGMLGCAVAAREHRLLTMSALSLVLRGRVQTVANAVASAVGVAVCAALAAAETSFVIAERTAGAER